MENNDPIIILINAQENADIFKGKQPFPIGTKKSWGDRQYMKTSSGWKSIGIYSGAAKQAHDFVHGADDEEKEEEVINKSKNNNTMNEFQKSQAAKILSCYGGAIEDTIKKSEETSELLKGEKQENLEGAKEKDETEGYQKLEDEGVVSDNDEDNKKKKKEDETKKSESDSVIDSPTGE